MSMDGNARIDQREVERFKELFLKAAESEAENIARLLASQADNELLGRTEFELRHLILRVGGKTLEACTNQRAKKGGTKVAASRVHAGSRPAL